MKRCPTCEQTKALAEFYVQKSGKHVGKPTTECKPCVRVRSAAYYRANKLKATTAHREWVAKNREAIRFHKAKSAYGLTKEQFNSLPDICVICGDRDGLVFDHSHRTGRVRGRLCHSCNKGLGFFRDDPTLLLRAADYVFGVAKPDIFAATYEPVEES